MSTNFEHSVDFKAQLPLQFVVAQDSCESPLVSPEPEVAMVVYMPPKRTLSGVGRIVSRAKAMPEPIVEFESE